MMSADFTALLHDSRLLDFSFQPGLRTASLLFDCLRREIDGKDLQDKTVEFRLSNVSAIIVGYESQKFGVRPSAYQIQRRVTMSSLSDWPFERREAVVTINSAQMEDDALAGPHSEWLVGDAAALQHATNRIGLRIGSLKLADNHFFELLLIVSCSEFELWSGGLPLSLDVWRKQCESWWGGWRKLWANKTDEDSQKLEDAMIPAAESPPPDFNYAPPKEPAVAWENSDIPKALLFPISELFESRQSDDFERMAHVYPFLDVSFEKRTETLRRNSKADFGEWWYARAVDGWWIEGNYSEVHVRGIEHRMPFEEDREINRESVWVFRLRYRPGVGWIIRTWCQGWPCFNSARALDDSAKPWLKQWTSGPVITQRSQIKKPKKR